MGVGWKEGKRGKEGKREKVKEGGDVGTWERGSEGKMDLLLSGPILNSVLFDYKGGGTGRGEEGESEGKMDQKSVLHSLISHVLFPSVLMLDWRYFHWTCLREVSLYHWLVVLNHH